MAPDVLEGGVGTRCAQRGGQHREERSVAEGAVAIVPSLRRRHPYHFIPTPDFARAPVDGWPGA